MYLALHYNSLIQASFRMKHGRFTYALPLFLAVIFASQVAMGMSFQMWQESVLMESPSVKSFDQLDNNAKKVDVLNDITALAVEGQMPFANIAHTLTYAQLVEAEDIHATGPPSLRT